MVSHDTYWEWEKAASPRTMVFFPTQEDSTMKHVRERLRAENKELRVLPPLSERRRWEKGWTPLP